MISYEFGEEFLHKDGYDPAETGRLRGRDPSPSTRGQRWGRRRPSPPARMAFRRHVPPVHDSKLKNCAFGLMTLAASIARAPAALNQPAIYRNARRIRDFVAPLRSAVRLRTTTAPALRPGHKVGAVVCPLRGRRISNHQPSPTEIRIPSLTVAPPTSFTATRAPRYRHPAASYGRLVLQFRRFQRGSTRTKTGAAMEWMPGRKSLGLRGESESCEPVGFVDKLATGVNLDNGLHCRSFLLPETESLPILSLPAPPKFQKRTHHVVPAFWQRHFSFPGEQGPYYKNIISGQTYDAQGPGEKMSEEYGYIVFDEYFRPSDALEDHLSNIEAKASQGISRAISDSIIDTNARCDIAYLFATQACRYPDLFERRLDHARYFAIALCSSSDHSDANALNLSLHASGILPGASISDSDFQNIRSTPKEALEIELDEILSTHGYEHFFNPALVFSGAMQIASQLLALQWEFVCSNDPAFILGDRPVPIQIGHGFKIGLSACFALLLSKPIGSIDEQPLRARTATNTEIDQINADVRSRARKWICGPGTWVHGL